MTTAALDLSGVPQAHSVTMATCGHCRFVHVVLHDRDDRPFAHFTVPDGFIKQLQDASYSIVAQLDGDSR